MKKTGIELLDDPTRFIALCRSGQARRKGMGINFLTYQCDGEKFEVEFECVQKDIKNHRRSKDNYRRVDYYTMRMAGVCVFEVRFDGMWQNDWRRAANRIEYITYANVFLRLDDGITTDDFLHHMTMMMLTREDVS